jgi:hydroxymethylpyrimidine/phosphomethylpyrimidine kinase
VHGTGCALSAAITAGLARGDKLLNAIQTAKEFTARAIAGHRHVHGRRVLALE